MIKDSNYIVILAPMITNLKLKGNELLIFAIIHGFTQDGESEYTGGTKYLQEWTNIDKSTVLAVLKRLTEKGFVTKKEQFFNNVKFCNYSSNYEDLLKVTPGRKIQPPPVGKSNLILL